MGVSDPPPPPSPLRMGIPGAARIAPMGWVRPARQVPEAEVLVVSTRDAVANMRVIDALYAAVGMRRRGA